MRLFIAHDDAFDQAPPALMCKRWEKAMRRISHTRVIALAMWWMSALLPVILLLPLFRTSIFAILLTLAMLSVAPMLLVLGGIACSVVGKMWSTWSSALACIAVVLPAIAAPPVAMAALAQPYDPTGACAGDGPEFAAICPQGPTAMQSIAPSLLVGLVVVLVIGSAWWLRRIRSTEQAACGVAV